MDEFLRHHQLNIMIAFSSICFVIALYAAVTKNMPKLKKRALIYLELSTGFLLFFDRYAYIYRGNESVTGYWMVRIANFCVFFLSICVEHAFNLYLLDLCRNEMHLPAVPRRLRVVEIVVGTGWLLIILNVFFGFYYTFDATNHYQRESGFLISYIVPLFTFILQLTVVIQYRKLISHYISFSLMLFTTVPIIFSVMQIFTYGLSLTNLSMVGMAILLYIFVLYETNDKLERANKLEIEYLKKEQKSMQRLFEQTASALANAIDAKDNYTQGHSVRVAEYSREIAKRAGKEEQECDQVYYTALLHDVGKIGVADTIISKDSGLSDEEYNMIKQHPAIGGEILSTIREFPFLSIGARYHHERYDGKGYLEGLKGEQIPDIARIVAVADTYDAMTSKRSYRDPLPQRTVREEFVKNAGTQFDPEYAKIMLDMIDADKEYQMKDDGKTDDKEINDLSQISEMYFAEYKDRISDGIPVTSNITRIQMECQVDKEFDSNTAMPAIVLFDSYDGCVHKDDTGIRILHYLEYGEIWFDGHTVSTAARNMKTDIKETEGSAAKPLQSNREQTVTNDKASCIRYEVEATRYDDHIRIRIMGNAQTVDTVISLSDNARRAYMGITGEHCHITDVHIDVSEEEIKETYIPRISPKVSYIDRMEGNIPNIQVDGNRTAATKGVPVADGMRLAFHSMSFPSSNLIWHCAYILLFTSDDATVGGTNYRELVCVRLDGEDDTRGEGALNELSVYKEDAFEGWDAWKEYNKKGFDCKVTFVRRKNKITMTTQNAGISFKNVTTTEDIPEQIYVSLTGNRVALTDIWAM